jgi:hypothetical protein
MTILMFISLFVVRTNLQTIRPRNWTMIQALSDAYMTEHLAHAEAIPFDELVTTPDEEATWPVYPANNSNAVIIGQVPGGREITGRLIQTRQPAPNNLASAGGIGTTTTNLARVEAWLVQSHLTYNVGDRSYVKSRNTVRTR